jgi:arsenite methyltransferase
MTMSKASSQYFEQVADQWDNLRSGYFTEAVRQTAISKSYLRPEMVVADVGAGTGYMAAGLAPLVRQVHVLDGSPAMIAVARKNLSSMDHIDYHEADGQSLSLEDASIDVVFANMYLHHCPDPQASIQEMVRVLKPGGRLVITDMDTHPYAWLKEEMADEWMGFERDQIRSWFKEADLVNVIVDSTGQSCSSQSQNTTTAEQERSANIGVFVATGTRRLSMREAVQNNYGLLAELGRSNSIEKPAEIFDVVSALSGLSCCNGSSMSQSCCSSAEYLPYQSILFATDYTVEDKATVPSEAEEISLGCGNPIAMANLKPGEIVLDIGSGGGIDAFLASNRVGPTGRVIGVDMTPAMLDRARGTAKRAGIENVEFRYGQAEKMPVDDGTIDVILSNCVINLCEDKGMVFQEAFRVLKPGGRLEVSDMVTGGPLPLEIRSKSNDWAGCVSGALPEPEYLDLIAQAGFTRITSIKSTSSGEMLGVPVYSAIVSARKR